MKLFHRSVVVLFLFQLVFNFAISQEIKSELINKSQRNFLQLIANDQAVSLKEDSTLLVVLSSKHANLKKLTYKVVTAPAHGALTGTGSARTSLGQKIHLKLELIENIVLVDEKAKL